MEVRKVWFMSLIVVLCFSVFAHNSLAQEPFSVRVSADKEVVRPVDYATYAVYITNNLDRMVEVETFVWSTKTSWFFVSPASVTIAPDETKIVRVYVAPKKGTPEGLYTFQIEVRDRYNPDLRVVKKESIYVLKSMIVNIKKLVPSKQIYSPGEVVEIGVGVKNEGSDDTAGIDLWVEINVSGVDGIKSKKVKLPPLEVDEAKMVYANFTFDKYTAHGVYSVTARIMNDIGEVLDEARTSFTIEEVALLDKKKDVKTKLLERTITVTGTNVGNIEGTLTIMEPKSLPMLAYEFETMPEITREGNREYFVWRCELEPLEKCVVTYKVNYWPLVFVALGVILIAIIVLEVFQYPKMHKKAYKRGEEHKVLIRIKNRGRRTLKDVEIIDDVPGIFQVIREFDAGKPVDVKKMRGKTRIVWRFPQLKPGEEKLLAYRIKPLLDVEGGIKLPPAEISGRVGRRRIRTRTGEIIVK